MNYDFIKDIYKSIVNDSKLDNSALENFIVDRDNSFLLKHNVDAISKIFRFLDSQSDNIFVLNGFMGSGKTCIVDYILDFINENVLVFKNSYQEAINLDCVLLSLFKDFSIYHNEKKISLPKIDTDVFSEKMNAFIKYCDVPMLFVFDSFEINMRSLDSQKDILDFINYLSHFAKIKIIICSRSFKKEDLLYSDTALDYSLSSLTNDEMYELLELNQIKGSKYECEELFKVTRGHYLLLDFSILIMRILNVSLTAFSSEYKKSTKNFLEFLISKILSFSSEKFVKLLILLSSLRHGVSLEFLKTQNFATEEDLNFLIQKKILAEKFGKFYIKDYFKNEFIKSVNMSTKLKIHSYLAEVYDAELPLKPFDRLLFLSRITMRQELTYHKKKVDKIEDEISKIGTPKLNEKQALTYLSYSKSSGYEPQMEKALSSQDKRYVKNIRPRKIRNDRFQLSKEDSLLLNYSSSVDEISKKFESIVNEPVQENEIIISPDELVPDSLDDYLKIAQEYEEAYNFSDAVKYYMQALSYIDDEMFSIKQPLIYTKLAICYKKIQNVDESIKYYEKVYQLYLSDSPEKANDILLSIAQIYLEVYKFDKAKEIYKRILYSSSEVSQEMIARVYMSLAEIEDNSLNTDSALTYMKMAITTVEKLANVQMLTEVYFKYASLMDDINDIDLAMKYYLRCIQTSANYDENLYLASAYTNLAEISFERGNISAAKMYFDLSIDVDKAQNNFEGLYYSYSKLAEIYKEENPSKTYELLLKALSSAKKLDDVSYSISVYVDIGDYYLSIEQYRQALKSYIVAKSVAPSQLSDDLNTNINVKLNKIKLLLGEDEFERLVLDIKKKK